MLRNIKVEFTLVDLKRELEMTEQETCQFFEFMQASIDLRHAINDIIGRMIDECENQINLDDLDDDEDDD